MKLTAEELKAKASHTLVLKVTRHRWNFDDEVYVRLWDYITHYMLSETEELGYIAFSGGVHVFDPPRVWHKSFLPHYARGVA